MSKRTKALGASASMRQPEKQDSKPTLVPKLRFPEFRDAEGWAEKPLKAAAHINPANGGLPESFVYIDLESVDAGVLNAKERISRIDAPSRAQRLVERGDIIYQVVRPYQRNNLLCEFDDYEHYVASTGYALLRAKGSNRFLYQCIHTDSFVGRIIAKCTGSNYPAINSSDLAEIQLPIPPTFPEQQKIAECLSSVDELMAAQARKVDALKTHKKGLMQQLFPREGETQPRLRFPEFQNAGEWEKRKISDVLVKKAEPATLDINDLYQEIGIRSHGKGLFHKVPVTGKSIGTKRVFHVVPNALVINIVFAWELALAVTTHDEMGFIASHRFPMFVPRDNRCEVNFIQRQFLTPVGKELLKIASPGGAGRNRTLSQYEFENLEVALPSTPEQQRIALCLTSLDDLIAAQTQKLEALKTHKKGLMQQLFPSLEES